MFVKASQLFLSRCMVGLGGKERALGEAAKSKIASNIANTVVEIKRLIGRK
jgi:molecular chaperone DnaK (HSP70)